MGIGVAMSHWWDDDKKKYRFSVTHYVVNVWLWPVERWLIYHLMKPEQAHWFAIHIAIPVVHVIDRIEGVIRAIIIVPIILLLYALSFLPGFSWNDKNKAMGNDAETE